MEKKDFIKRYQVAILAMVWIIAILTTSQAIYQSVNIVKLESEMAGMENIPNITLDRSTREASQDEIMRASKFLQSLHPGLSINTNGATMRVSARFIQDYQEWRFALADLALYADISDWTIKSFCISQCQGGNYLDVELTGKHYSYILK